MHTCMSILWAVRHANGRFAVAIMVLSSIWEEIKETESQYTLVEHYFGTRVQLEFILL